MTSGIRITLWLLSSLAVLWTIGALVMGVAMMGGMMGGACPMCGTGMDGAGMGGSGMGGGGMMWMMLTMGLTWLVMLGLDAVFVYLIVTEVRRRRSADVPAVG